MNLNSFLGAKAPVILVANDTLEGKPLITPFLDGQGNPKTDNNGAPIGSIRLEQTQPTLTGGFLNAHTRVAFIGASIVVLEKIIATNKLKAGSEIAGKIVIEESLEPFFPKQKPKMNPNTQAIVQIEANGELHDIYMRMRYTDNEKETDSLLRNSNAVRNWLNANRINKEVANLEVKMPVENARIPNGNAPVLEEEMVN